MSKELSEYYSLYHRLEALSGQVAKREEATQAKLNRLIEKLRREAKELERNFDGKAADAKAHAQKQTDTLEQQYGTAIRVARAKGSTPNAKGQTAAPEWPDFETLQQQDQKLADAFHRRERLNEQLSRLQRQLAQERDVGKAKERDITVVVVALLGLVLTSTAIFMTGDLGFLVVLLPGFIAQWILGSGPSHMLNSMQQRSPTGVWTRSRRKGRVRILSHTYMLVGVILITMTQSVMPAVLGTPSWVPALVVLYTVVTLIVSAVSLKRA